MRVVKFNEIVDKVSYLCIEAAYNLPDDVCEAIENCYKNEELDSAKDILNQCITNFKIAKEEQVPICQDTGFSVFLVEIGKDVKIDGGFLEDAINEGTAKGYKEGFLRNSIVSDPLYDRKNTGNNTPAVVHQKIVSGDKIKIILAPKGGGSENMSTLKMLRPSDGEEGVINFIVDTIKNAGGNPCPPTVVGVGIGGSFEKCAYLAKEALFRKIGSKNSDPRYAELENKILEKLNISGVGPQGLGGSSTSFAVHVNFWPCHLASLPVAININCHAARHAEVTI